MNRKPFNGRAGYVASKKNPLTNIHNVIYIALEQSIDADGKYVTVCEAHGQMVSSKNIPNARVDMKDATRWCSSCQSLVVKCFIADPLAVVGPFHDCDMAGDEVGALYQERL